MQIIHLKNQIVGTDKSAENIQLLLHHRVHRGVSGQNGGAGCAASHSRPMESAGRGHRHPLHRRHHPRGNGVQCDPHQPDYHPSHARPPHRPRLPLFVI